MSDTLYHYHLRRDKEIYKPVKKDPIDKFLFIDTETTSADKNKCGLWQIGGVVECGKHFDEFLFECDVFEGDEISEEALQAGNISLEKLSTLPDPWDAFKKFQKMLSKYVDKYDKLDKFHVFAYSADFDNTVLRHWFIKNDDSFFGSWFWHPWICIMTLTAAQHITDRKKFSNFQLKTVAEYLKIDIIGKKDFHNALFDSKVARDIYHKVKP
jgi:DNA polymerase-3 subunit epsilon